MKTLWDRSAQFVRPNAPGSSGRSTQVAFRQQSLLNLQRLAGNAAVTAHLRRAADSKSTGGDTGEVESDRKLFPFVQRANGLAAPGTAVATVAPTIRAANSPAVMKNRIAPGADESVSVSASGLVPPMANVEFSVEGSGTAAGTVTINGAAGPFVPAADGNQNLTLRGTVQTAPGSGGGLSLVARQGAIELARSHPFSVSAIPQDYTDTFVSLLTDHRRGFIVQDGWVSDSPGGLADLDQAEISEQVEYGENTGCFRGRAAGHNSVYLPANQLSQDTHSRGKAELILPGRLVAQQMCTFNDKRSGSNDIPMRNSGYILTREVEQKPGGGLVGAIARAMGTRDLVIITSKVGSAATAKGFSSAAGVGNIVKRQSVSTGAEV
jgi:hypothetical protein